MPVIINFLGYLILVRDYFLYHLTDTEFEDLVSKICLVWFGNGITPFAKGKDGGRDAKFSGKAQSYPSSQEQWSGEIVIQAKHTAKPDASCSDNNFKKYFLEKTKSKGGGFHKDSEVPKVKRLIEEKILDYYVVFTNRKLTGGADEKILKEVNKLKPKGSHIVGLEQINLFLKENPKIARALPTHGNSKPFEFTPDDMVDVISGVYDAIQIENASLSGAKDFGYLDKKKEKNKINNMSNSYYQAVIVNEYMPLFSRLKDFLQDERNKEYRDIYHDIADELRQKIIIFRDRFDCFEEIILYLVEAVKDARPDLKGKRRYVTFLLCYMYFDCDIGERE